MAAPVPTPDWPSLRLQATDMTARSYAPYSGVQVGAAGLVDDGRFVAGCNVENASYGLSICAECSLVADLFRTGGGRLVAVAVVGVDGRYMAPCGRCRQVLMEVGGPELLVETDRGVVTLDTLLPGAFGPHELGPGARSGPPSTDRPTGEPPGEPGGRER